MNFKKLPYYYFVFLGLIALLSAPSTSWADSMLRIRCNPELGSPKIYLNDQFVGDCDPIIMMSIKRGQVRIFARLQPDQDHERVWESVESIPDNSVKVIEVKLSELRLTAAANEALIADLRRKVNENDLTAIKELSERYKEGRGVPLDYAEAQKLISKYTQIEQENRHLALKKEFEDFSFFHDTKSFSTLFKMNYKDPTSVSVTISTGPSIIIPLFSDMLKAPTNTTEYFSLKEKAEAHAAIWGAPHSLMAELVNAKDSSISSNFSTRAP